MLNKQKVDRLMKSRGESRGMNIKIDLDFVIEKKGKQGLKKIEAKMKELGYPLEYKKIRAMDFYPIGLEVVILLTIEEIFNFDEEKLKEMGTSVVKFSLLMKIFLKYLGSLKLIAKQIPGIWKEHYTIGSLEMLDFSDKKRYVVLREKNFNINHIYCKIHKGYFVKVAEMVVKKPVSCKETKCMFKGDPYHEFLLTW